MGGIPQNQPCHETVLAQQHRWARPQNQKPKRQTTWMGNRPPTQPTSNRARKTKGGNQATTTHRQVFEPGESTCEPMPWQLKHGAAESKVSGRPWQTSLSILEHPDYNQREGRGVPDQTCPQKRFEIQACAALASARAPRTSTPWA